jgi:hypothetical protein
MTNVGTLPASVVAQLKGDIGNTGAAGSNGSDGSFDGTLKTINGSNLVGSGDLSVGSPSVIAGAFGSTSSFSFTPTSSYFYVWGCGAGGASRHPAPYNAGAGGGSSSWAIMAKVSCTANTSVSVSIGTGSGGNGGATTFTQGSVIASLGGGSEATYYSSPGAGGSHSGFTGYVRSGQGGSGYSGFDGNGNPYGNGGGGKTDFTIPNEHGNGVNYHHKGGEGGHGESDNQPGTNGWAIVLY